MVCFAAEAAAWPGLLRGAERCRNNKRGGQAEQWRCPHQAVGLLGRGRGDLLSGPSCTARRRSAGSQCHLVARVPTLGGLSESRSRGVEPSEGHAHRVPGWRRIPSPDFPSRCPL